MPESHPDSNGENGRPVGDIETEPFHRFMRVLHRKTVPVADPGIRPPRNCSHGEESTAQQNKKLHDIGPYNRPQTTQRGVQNREEPDSQNQRVRVGIIRVGTEKPAQLEIDDFFHRIRGSQNDDGNPAQQQADTEN